MKDSKVSDNQLKELEQHMFEKAKKRLRKFVIGFSEAESEQTEMGVILCHYKHRYASFYSILKEALRA